VTTSLLEIKDLHVWFSVYGGTLRVLDGVNFQLGKSEKVGLVGEAGCGKTTTMKSILRILPRTARIPRGEVFFGGKDVLKMSSKDVQRVRRRGISMIFQDPTAALNPVFKIGEQITDVIRYSTIDPKTGKDLPKEEIRARAVQVLQDVALPDPERIMDNYPIQLSGGMRQRVCIAMALVSAHDLLIADEPGTSLDVTIQDQILRLLGQLAEERGISVILISHALGAVRGLVDRVYVMYAGNIVEVAKTQDLFSNPLHPYAQGLLKAVPKLTGGGIPESIRGRIPSYLNPPEGCRFHPRCEHTMPICEKDRPRLLDAGNRDVACFLYQK